MKWIIYIGMCILILLNVNAYSEIIYNYDNLDIFSDSLLSDPLEENQPLKLEEEWTVFLVKLFRVKRW